MKKLIESVTYESPKAEILLLTSEGVLCESGPWEGTAGATNDDFEPGGNIPF